MRTRLSILALIGAFLFSAWGNVIAAAFCPHYLSKHNCETNGQPQQVQQVNQGSSCHDEMADMEMDHMQMGETEMESAAEVEASDDARREDHPIQIGTETSSQQVVIDLPAEPCGHCWMHSQSASGAATLAAVDPAKQSIDTHAPPAESAVTVPIAISVSITPQEHGPPGNVIPRHVLINVFRI